MNLEKLTRRNFFKVVMAASLTPLTLARKIKGLELLSNSIALTVNNLYLELDSARCWTMSKLMRNGFMICDGSISGQGTVLRIDGNWAGSWHGNESLLDASIFVNGQKEILEQGHSYTGDNIVFSRRTSLNNAYILNSKMNITNDRVDEEVSLQGFNEDKLCNIFYGFLGSKDNRLTDYIAFGEDCSIVYEGQANRDDNSEINLKPSIAVAQYDPLVEDCVLSVCTKGSDLGLKYFIWDRPTDNKLYARFLGAEGPCALQNFYELSSSILFFDSPSGNWRSDSANLLGRILEEIICKNKRKGDLNNDCKVDFKDFSIFAENWLKENSE